MRRGRPRFQGFRVCPETYRFVEKDAWQKKFDTFFRWIGRYIMEATTGFTSGQKLPKGETSMRSNRSVLSFRGNLLAAAYIALSCGPSLFAQPGVTTPLLVAQPGVPFRMTMSSTTSSATYVVPPGERLAIENVNASWNGPAGSTLYVVIWLEDGAINPPGSAGMGSLGFTTTPASSGSIASGNWPVRAYVMAGGAPSLTVQFYANGTWYNGTPPPGASVTITGHFSPMKFQGEPGFD